MIYGVGTDILEIKRISKILNNHDKKFINRIYGSKEINIAKNITKNLDYFLAKRFAAKEATWKAFSSNRGDGFIFKEIEYKTYGKVCDSFAWGGGNMPITLYNHTKDKLWDHECTLSGPEIVTDQSSKTTLIQKYQT